MPDKNNKEQAVEHHHSLQDSFLKLLVFYNYIRFIIP